jgi:hypothetical protein
VADNDYHVQMNVRMVNLLRQMYSHGPHLKNTPSQKKKKKSRSQAADRASSPIKTNYKSKFKNQKQITNINTLIKLACKLT